MNMDNIKLFAKNEKRIGNPDTDSEDIHSGYRAGIWDRKMCHANNEKWKTTNDGRNGTTKSRKDNFLRIYEVDTIKHAEMK